MILGTAAYMPPEQARGKAVDRRADIWAFGVVLYEMLTGSRGYTGETAAETLAAVLKEELDWSRLPAETPRAVHRLLRRCLEKDPKRRLRDIGEARVMLEEAESPEEAVPSAVIAAPARRAWLPWTAAGILLVVAVVFAWLYLRQTPQVERVLRYTIAPPEKSSVHSFAISPDGRYLAIAGTLQGTNHLWVRRPGCARDAVASRDRRGDVPVLVARQPQHWLLRAGEAETHLRGGRSRTIAL